MFVIFIFMQPKNNQARKSHFTHLGRRQILIPARDLEFRWSDLRQAWIHAEWWRNIMFTTLFIFFQWKACFSTNKKNPTDRNENVYRQPQKKIKLDLAQHIPLSPQCISQLMLRYPIGSTAILPYSHFMGIRKTEPDPCANGIGKCLVLIFF